MKVRAIRLREVGIFREPIAIEGFTGGLDVLAGPNELGKSTILAALKRLFLYKPSSKHAHLEQLRPHGGGAPLIEADFEARGKLWRLRKQFLTGRGVAELTDLQTNKILERGPEAHARALHLIGLQEEELGPLGLLWVGQSEGLALKAVAASERQLLLSAIEAEVAAVAGGQAMRSIQEQIETELAVLVTGKTGKPKANSDYDKALKEQARLTAELRTAEEQARFAEERLAELMRLRTQYAQLADPIARAAADQTLTSARQSIENGRRAREQYKLALTVQQNNESRRAHLAAEAKALRDRLAEQTQITATLAELSAQLATAEAAEASAMQAAEQAAAQRSDGEAKLADAQSQLRRREQADVVADLRHRLAGVRAATAEQSRLADRMAGRTATDGLVRKAQNEVAEIQSLAARLDAAAPRVSIAYLPGVAPAILTGGQVIADGTELRPTQALLLDIAGVGRVTITPVAAVDLADVAADLDAHRQELAATLAVMGVADLDAAREALALRRDLEAQRTALAGRASSLAPSGIPDLEERLSAAQGKLDAHAGPDDELPSREDLSKHSAVLDQAYRAAVKAADAAARLASQHAQVMTRVRTMADSAVMRRAALAAELVELVDPTAHLQGIETQLTAAAAAVNAAVREVAAWSETAPSEEKWTAQQTALQRHEQTQSRAIAEINTLTQAIAHVEGELARGGDSDVAQRIDELSGALEEVRSKTSHYKQEADALSLLSHLIDEAETSSQDRFLAPVLARIEPYLHRVLPEARLHLTKDLAPTGLARGMAPEAVATLSGGTQEQLAVLTRLGFGRLLADRGQATPVILDDALVYSDDTRIERLFEVLREASQHHQVIVLTCRSRLFETLGGTRLEIVPWKVE